MRVAVAGGTGVVGRYVVRALADRGHETVTMSRSTGVDVYTGDGLDRALTGVDAVIDVASVQTMRRKVAVDFFGTTTANLLRAEREADVGHHVLLSIVGIDDMPSGYYAGKVAQETLVTAGEVPWSIVRATQFHEFLAQLLRRARVGPVALIPRLKVETVAAREVAEVLVDLVEAGPSGRTPDLGGPQVARLDQLAKTYLRTTGQRTPLVGVPMPGRFGALVTGPGSRHGRITFDEWLLGDGRDVFGG
ncbi:NAD(P)H-binding protein [Kribbella sp. NBC_01245]|uniref:SDR family oxidoreductase n=1 Tax=Kribbella sp. NBC_01245 TaxID=2903578 RepID=UPI002E2BB4CA|nr:NAD(P)H-binding protein [Kribbella sp. NBC_01245]